MYFILQRIIPKPCRRLLAYSCLAGSKAIGGCELEQYTTIQKGEGGLPLQTSHVTVEVVLVSRNGTGVGVLPKSVVVPPVRQSTGGAGIVSDP